MKKLTKRRQVIDRPADPADEFLWRVMRTEADGVVVTFGPKISAAHADEAAIHVLGKTLIKIGTGLLSADCDDVEWED